MAAFNCACSTPTLVSSALGPLLRSASRRSYASSMASRAFFSLAQFTVPIVSVPLKAMCSNMWAMPVSPDGSSTDPAFTYVWNETTGASCRSATMKCSPFASVNSVTFFSNSLRSCARRLGANTRIMQRRSPLNVPSSCTFKLGRAWVACPVVIVAHRAGNRRRRPSATTGKKRRSPPQRNQPSLLDVLFHVLGADFRTVDVALRIRRHTFRRARNGGSGRRIRDEGGHRAVFRAPHPDASFPAGVMTVALLAGGFGIGHIHHVVLVDEDSARAAELLPFVEKLTVLVEDLDPVVGAVADEQPSFGIERERMGNLELAVFRSMASPLFNEFSILGELHDSGIPSLRIMAVRNEDVAIRSDGDGVRLIEGVRAVTCDASLAEGHQDLAIRTEFKNLVTLSISSLAVGDPQVALFVHQDAVGKHEHARPPALQKLAGRIEFQHGGQRRTRAGIDAAPLGYPHVTAGSDKDGTRGSHGPAFGEREPVLHCAVRIGLRIGLSAGWGERCPWRQCESDRSQQRES